MKETIHEGHEGTRRIERVSFVDRFFHWLRPGCAILLSGHFLFFMYAFHAAISIRYWFAIDIAIRYRYRSYRAFPIAIARGPRHPLRLGCAVISVLLSVVFLFFVHVFHAAISLTYWFAIDIAIDLIRLFR
uniref:Uncharacterized protein n=1 Tax=Candidatus Kentrum sp. FM TaxID=2126340 RepID=A0A450TPG6_9GAMM|nr:MAG: hypothetical protein BECKFM1743A_GA0114220_105183 [Candidatus Kentron sp. FM]VFK17805.1 MAG: hypothetical protein BECKFM1743B_GA0114221_105033 [Candidatus Kentron sp. FM]